MTNDRKQKQAYGLFTGLGFSVLLLTIFEIAVGQETFLLLLYMVLWPIGLILILGLCVLALAAIVVAFQCKEDRMLLALGVITIPYAIFAADNVLYFFDWPVVANDTVEVVSIAYSIACIAARLRWFIIGNRTPRP